MVNKVILVGNIGKDIEVRQAGKTEVADISVATSSSKKVGDKWEKVTEWNSVTVFGKRATSLAEHAGKGTLVYVEGRKETQKWTDKKGDEKSKVVIIADSVKILSGSITNRGEMQEPDNQNTGADDDVPF